jgi:hypothetical protein
MNLDEYNARPPARAAAEKAFPTLRKILDMADEAIDMLGRFGAVKSTNVEYVTTAMHNEGLDVEYREKITGIFTSREDIPKRLSIWSDGVPVLQIRWTEANRFDIRHFKRGDWEERALLGFCGRDED